MSLFSNMTKDSDEIKADETRLVGIRFLETNIPGAVFESSDDNKAMVKLGQFTYEMVWPSGESIEWPDTTFFVHDANKRSLAQGTFGEGKFDIHTGTYTIELKLLSDK